MIPALLTCVFVAYLYLKLNPKPESSSTSEAAPEAGAEEFSTLSDRLAALERRLQRLSHAENEEPNR